MTDSQIVNEKFLVSINDILSSGYVPELFAEDERDEIRGKVRAEAKSNGVPDMPEDLWNFYLDKVRKNMHMGLCFSPVSEKFRIRARMFPGLINCTSIDWFHEWPEDALIGVANRFLKEVELPSDELRDNIAKHMAFVHISIGEANFEFKKVERRHNYTTPTSFLELINFYKMLLGQKQGVITDQIARLEIGLGIMETTTAKVDNLKSFLE
jgi:dynein heavy chain